MNLEKYKQEAINKTNEHKKYLNKLKNKKPKKLDGTLFEIHEEVFNNINCLNCANCCKTTGPLFTEKDIDRISKHLRLKSTTFIDQYLYMDEDNDWILKNLPCPFLDNENYCLIYEVRPKACKEYPHTDRKKFYQINKLTEKNIIICPATYEIVNSLMNKLPL